MSTTLLERNAAVDDEGDIETATGEMRGLACSQQLNKNALSFKLKERV
jgi:hypothetical protein